MVQNTNFHQSFRFNAENPEGIQQSISMSPAPSFKIGPYFGWRWIFVGYTFDVANPRGVRKTQEFSLSLYSAMLGCDMVYVKNDGNFRLHRTIGFPGVSSKQFSGTRFDGLESGTLSLNAYYVFNHRRFSYPAGFAQSTVQRKSAGSWMLGFRFDHHHLDFDYTALPDELIGEPGKEHIIDELKLRKIDYFTYSLSGGYAYNWAFAPRWLLASSMAPAIGFRRAKGEKLKGDDLWVNMRRFNFDFLARVGLVWNNTRFYAGASLISHFFNYRKQRFSITNSINYVNIYFGLNFHRKSQYRGKKMMGEEFKRR